MIYSFLFVLAASMGAVMTQFVDTHIPPFLSLFIAGIIATLFFNLINITKIKHIYIGCWQQKWLYLAIMLTILVMWICTINGPGLIGASLYILLYFTWLGILGFSSQYLINRNENSKKLYFAIGALLLLIVAIGADLGPKFSLKDLLGVFLSIVGGTSAFIYFKQSQAIMKKAQLSATQILAVRFYLTIIVAWAFIPHEAFKNYFTLINFSEILFLAILSLIIPLFFQQKALEKITAEKNAIIMSLTPTATGFIQEVIFHNVSKIYFLIYVCYFILIICSCIFKSKKVA
jgi:drug/metabolite transporter (DMT)-like permease